MDARKMILSVCVAGLVLSLLGGCPLMPSRTNNQGGGNIITAGMKIAEGRMTTLTPDEVQIITDFIIATVPDIPEEVEPLTDDQAEAVVIFLQDNNLNTIEDVEDLMNNPEDVVISDEVLEALETLADINLEDLDLDTVL